jgi:hypothetical protein
MKMDFIKQMRKETEYQQNFRFEQKYNKQNSAYIVRGVGSGKYIYVHQYWKLFYLGNNYICKSACWNGPLYKNINCKMKTHYESTGNDSLPNIISSQVVVFLITTRNSAENTFAMLYR